MAGLVPAIFFWVPTPGVVLAKDPHRGISQWNSMADVLRKTTAYRPDPAHGVSGHHAPSGRASAPSRAARRARCAKAFCDIARPSRKRWSTCEGKIVLEGRKNHWL